MYVDLKRIILDLAAKNELKLHGFTTDAIDEAVRAAKNNKNIKPEEIMEMLKKKDQLRKGFGKNEWNEIEKQVEKMLK